MPLTGHASSLLNSVSFQKGRVQAQCKFPCFVHQVPELRFLVSASGGNSFVPLLNLSPANVSNHNSFGLLVGQSGLSSMGQQCKEAGLDSMFLAAMKISSS